MAMWVDRCRGRATSSHAQPEPAVARARAGGRPPRLDPRCRREPGSGALDPDGAGRGRGCPPDLRCWRPARRPDSALCIHPDVRHVLVGGPSASAFSTPEAAGRHAGPRRPAAATRARRGGRPALLALAGSGRARAAGRGAVRGSSGTPAAAVPGQPVGARPGARAIRLRGTDPGRRVRQGDRRLDGDGGGRLAGPPRNGKPVVGRTVRGLGLPAGGRSGISKPLPRHVGERGGEASHATRLTEADSRKERSAADSH